MDIKYFTPALKVGSFYLEVPASQRTAESGASSNQWIFVPEGIHTVQAVWQGDKATVVRYRLMGASGNGRDIISLPGGTASTPKTTVVVAPPGGAQLYITLAAAAAVADDVLSTKIITAGITVFMGTNEI